ncbi:MAG: tRNA threonylcarbamoyladenosine biosynthesis protein RimN, partial [Gammaproteobacteria bacterium]
YPTDTVYGLGCNPYNQQAVELINTIKQRPLNKQFILLASDIDQVRPLLQLDDGQEKTITQRTEPTSWIVNANQKAPAWLVDENNTITTRISKHANIERLCSILGHAIISTSANISGKRPARNTLDLHKYFHDCVDKIITSDQNQMVRPSKIIRLCDNEIIRH